MNNRFIYKILPNLLFIVPCVIILQTTINLLLMPTFWSEKRKAAHWILEQLLKDTIETVSQDYIINEYGKIVLHKNHVTHRYDESRVRIIYLIESEKYIPEVIYKAITLLFANKHIESVNEDMRPPLNEIEIKATPQGAIALIEDYYLEIVEEKKSNWPKRNWMVASILTHVLILMIGGLIGLLLPKLPTLKSSQETLKHSTMQANDSLNIK